MRELIFYKTYFRTFYEELEERARNKIDYALLILQTQPIVPQKFVKHLSGSDGIYEARASVGSNEYRILFFFEKGSLIEGGKIVVVGNGFLKKDERDYRHAIELAECIKAEYFAELEQTGPDKSE
ncbi:MAG: type II toxin-antitoxin system RelE/ParE family toxin [Saprospiraceae bacterium]|nr:type II toxin-antitoxin system RelE/ParE family toxin [Saprospiraceae bacterium]